MMGLAIMLSIGAIFSCIFGALSKDSAGEFIMRLVFMEAVQVLLWALVVN
jgi:hypothetical protein